MGERGAWDVDLCGMLGEELTEKAILPIYARLLVDTNTKVRLNVVSNFDKIKAVTVGERDDG